MFEAEPGGFTFRILLNPVMNNRLHRVKELQPVPNLWWEKKDNQQYADSYCCR